MTIMKIFDPSELNLTDEEERELAERCGGSSDSCYKTFEVLSPEDALGEWGEDDEIDMSVNEKLLAIGLVEFGEYVMIDLCW